MTIATTPLSEVLKAETAEHHKRAEGKPIQRAMLAGTVSRSEFIAWLGQMRLIHAELAASVHAAARLEPRVKMQPDCAEHERRLGADLASLGAGEIAPLGATGGLVASIRTGAPWELVGMQYVLEGSMNGNTHLARGVRRGLGLAPGSGDTYMDPYGARQRAVWAEFKVALDGLGLDGEESGQVVEGARVMFDGIAALGEELGATGRPA